MPDPLREPGFLTEHQLRGVTPERDIFLLACPGSGKTRTGGVRFARLMQEGTRVAATSYTNVGVDQVRDVVTGDLGEVVTAEHFVGTLHSLLLRYVFYPFGHLVMRCERPMLVIDDAAWPDVQVGEPRYRVPLPDYRFCADGTLRLLKLRNHMPHSIDQALRLTHAVALAKKRQCARRGWASFDDSMYWSLSVLQSHPEICRAVAGRFHEIQVDEAQDTSELQLACLKTISDSGRLGSLVLIGDIEQSIYSFQGASPQGCEDLASHRGLATVELTENHRSSQKICDVTYHLCSRTHADLAVGEHAACDIDPEITLYDPGDPHSSLAWFERRLDALGLDAEDAVVLARKNKFVDEINGEQARVDIKPRPKALGTAFLGLGDGGGITKRQIESVDRIVAFCAFGDRDLSEFDPQQRWQLRQASMSLLSQLSGPDTMLRSWIQQAAGTLTTVARTLCDRSAKTGGQVLQSAAPQEAWTLRNALTPTATALRAQTVHDVKGESRDAVMVVVEKNPRQRTREAQGALWSRSLRGHDLGAEAEEARIAFVALTRARRYCVIAFPSDTPEDVLAAFRDVGFVQST